MTRVSSLSNAPVSVELPSRKRRAHKRAIRNTLSTRADELAPEFSPSLASLPTHYSYNGEAASAPGFFGPSYNCYAIVSVSYRTRPTFSRHRKSQVRPEGAKTHVFYLTRSRRRAHLHEIYS